MSDPTCLYKYLPCNYAEDLIHKGIVHFKNAAYFCSIEEDGVRGDKYDGSEIFNNYITINSQSGEEIVPSKAFTVRSQEELKTTYLFCVSKILSANLFDEFESDCCVKIKNVDEFINRIINNANFINLDLTKRFFHPDTNKTKEVGIRISFETNLISNNVIYFDDSKVHDKVTLKSDIKQKFFHKRRSLYEWQKEFRILIEPKGEITTFCSKEDRDFLSNFKKQNSSRTYEFFPTGINLTIGSIEDIAEIIAKK